MTVNFLIDLPGYEDIVLPLDIRTYERFLDRGWDVSFYSKRLGQCAVPAASLVRMPDKTDIQKTYRIVDSPYRHLNGQYVVLWSARLEDEVVEVRLGDATYNLAPECFVEHVRKER